MPDDPPDSRSRGSRVFAHPAFLLLLTAALTGLLVPWITNRWEARDKKVEQARAAAERELEVKSALVTRIGTTSGRFLSAMEVRIVDAGGPEASSEYRALQTASLEIASQLTAYFPTSQPAVRWRYFTDGLRNAYLLLRERVGRPRNVWLDRLNRYLDVGPTQLDGLCFERTSDVFENDLRALVVALQNKEQLIVREIAASETILTGEPTEPVPAPLRHYDPTKPRPCDAHF
jgi:hypothetical protein